MESSGLFARDGILYRYRLWLVLAGLLLAGLWLPTLFTRHSTFIGDQRVWFLGDDAMISMRYAHNLAQGQGLTWNPGERIEGYTNFLWVLFMSLVHLLPVSLNQSSLVVLVANLLLAVATLPAVAGLVDMVAVRAPAARTPAVALALAAFVFDRSLMVWSTGGYEVTVLAFGFTWLLYRTGREIEAGRPRLATFIGAGLLAVIRADSLILTAIICLLALLFNGQRQKVLLYSALAGLFFAAHLLFRLAYYGDLLPNTAYLKAASFDGRWRAGLTYAWAFMRDYWLYLVLAIAGVVRAGRPFQAALLAAIFLYIGYVAAIGGDAFANHRFFVPVMPLLIVLAFGGLGRLFEGARGRILVPVAGLLALLTAPLYVVEYSYFLQPYIPQSQNVGLAFYLRDHTPPDSRIAESSIGTTFYFSGRTGIDLLGKVDRHVAHLPYTTGDRPGHNKFDIDYSLGVLRPDYVVVHYQWPAGDEARQALEASIAAGGPPYAQALQTNPLFRQYCLPHPMPIGPWRSVFACRWE
jgi:hypothetical protein